MSTARILVVDDNPTNLKLVSDILEFEGYEILRAVDAETAQEVIKRSAPDLILMDIALPGMDGLMLTRKLKSDESTRDIIIVALTAFAMIGDEQKALAAGCDGYVTKPIDTRKLPELVAEHLRRARVVAATCDLKILVVEDQPSELKLARHVLNAAGHDAQGTEAAEQVFQAIKQDRPQVILLDLSLPGMDGLDLARKLKADPETSGIPIVAMTAFPENFPKVEALAAGCDAYLLKPINTRTLPGQLAVVVGREKNEPKA